MIAFHMDMKMALLKPEALRGLMAECARLGYDTLLWEVEDAVAWETAPECAAAGAYTKAQFKALLAEGTRMGLTHVPLFQTLGHAEYVLRHAPYAPLRENPDALNMYCPRNPAVMPLLHRWIGEYLEVFGPVKDFHIGADEAWNLGTCPACKAFSAEQSKSRLFIDHINAVAAPLLEKGIRPLIWDDMLIHYPEALGMLDRRIALVDWLYDRYEGCGKANFFGSGAHTRASLPEPLLARYKEALYPEGDEPGRELDPFFQGNYLASAGFAVVTAPGSSSAGDSVFTSRNWLHVINSFDSARRGAAAGREGVIQTSWSIRLNPYDLQAAAIAAVPYAVRNPQATVRDFQRWFERDRFGRELPEFWPVAALVSTACLFSGSATLGFNHPPDGVPADQVSRILKGLTDRQEVAAQVRETHKLLLDYREAADRFAALKKQAGKGAAWLEIWETAARNLENRAEAALLFLGEIGAVMAGVPLTGMRREEAKRILQAHRELKASMEAFLRLRIQAERVPHYLRWMYGSVETVLVQLAGA